MTFLTSDMTFFVHICLHNNTSPFKPSVAGTLASSRKSKHYSVQHSCHTFYLKPNTTCAVSLLLHCDIAAACSNKFAQKG